MKRPLAAVTFIIGFLGGFASIIALPPSSIRTALFVLLILLGFCGLLSLLFQEVDLLFAYSNLKHLKCIGIRRIFPTGEGDKGAHQMSRAKNIKIMAVSANTLIKNRKKEIVNALREQRAVICVLLAMPNSDFVSDLEDIESPYREGHIVSEIKSAESLLSEYMVEAKLGRETDSVGNLKIGYYTTHLRSSLILCDESWGLLTLNIPPKRSVQSVSLELFQADNGLLGDCIRHFDRCWEIAERLGHVKILKDGNRAP